jgi:hypothetical protein
MRPQSGAEILAYDSDRADTAEQDSDGTLDYHWHACVTLTLSVTAAAQRDSNGS